ncbi:MAG TPA: amino acid ABC transporter permease [Candidatus Coprovicinus avistercoris]|uniref:Amino acid ABC transporter permease n=1 Tax=Candidatus Coprovicinus avistercoris TaxID=2840754 RepID=A0A9D1L4Z3_9ACTN|nr:amino acid ABC transporter permease [Candidatus Coprovicinus avistercoris]
MDLIGTLIEAWPLLWNGLKMTVYVTVVSLVIAMVLGILVCLMNISSVRPLRGVAKFYIWIIRGTPMLVQGFYIYFAIPQLLQLITGSQFRIDIVTATLITLTLNAGAYISEIFRGAIQSIDKGQMEASRSLGVGYATSMRKIILPQAIRVCLPSLVNQCIITLKDSTIMYALGLPEIMNQARVFVGRTMESFATYTWVALIFLAIISVLMVLSSILEKRMSKQ